MHEYLYKALKENVKIVTLATVLAVLILALSCTDVKLHIESRDFRLSVEVSR